MQVTHQNDHVTHVTIGGGQSVNFGISDSPEFFQILSSTLYQDQKRAVIRETLCNAWDAHIAAGLSDKPIKVTLTPQAMTIQDFGTGIEKSMIGPIYGTYGASTKKNDGKQTGGFGLGCKAPFAYTDHFQVTSSHNGERTIYNMSKSSGESMGKPSITPIASFPTTESGIIVSVNIINRDDAHTFQQLIKNVAYAGEMLVEYNGVLLETLPLSKAPHDFIITSRDFSYTGDNLWVRYGNVVYPIPNHESYATDYNRISRLVNHFGNSDRWSEKRSRIIFMAKPNSIAVTPSRESLSMQTHTIKTLGELLTNFKVIDTKGFNDESTKILRQQVDTAIKDKKYPEILTTNIGVPLREQLTKDKTQYVQDMPTAARALIVKEYPDNADVRFKDIKYRLWKLKQDKFEPRGLVSTLLDAIPVKLPPRVPGKPFRKAHLPMRTWFQRQVVRKLYRDMAASTVVEYERLRVFDKNIRSHSWDYVGSVHEPHQIAHSNTEHYFPYLRNIVVITDNISNMNRLHNVPLINEYDSGGYLLYIVDKKHKNLDEVRAFFNNRKYNVTDLTQALPGEPDFGRVAIPIDVPKREPVKRLKGLPALINVKTESGRIDFDLMSVDKRIEDAKIIVRKSPSTRSKSIGSFGPSVANIILEMYGDKVGVTTTTAQHDRLLAAGAVNIEPQVVRDTIAYIENSQSIQASFGVDPSRIKFSKYLVDEVVGMCSRSDTLSKEFGIENSLTNEDRKYLSIFEYLSNHPNKNLSTWNSLSNTTIVALSSKLALTPIHPKMLALIDMVEKSKTLPYINMSMIRNTISKSSSVGPTDVQFALDIFRNALKN
jgi:hypothetical protein